MDLPMIVVTEETVKYYNIFGCFYLYFYKNPSTNSLITSITIINIIAELILLLMSKSLMSSYFF